MVQTYRFYVEDKRWIHMIGVKAPAQQEEVGGEWLGLQL